jgi:hypothetical protein
MTPAERLVPGVDDSVRQMMETIGKDVSARGPIAWLDHFENSKDFFMASGGSLVFPNYDSAAGFVKTVVVRMMPKVELSWSNIRISALDEDYANIAADFHEDITDSLGFRKPSDGYFTGIAHHGASGWMVLNAHWSYKSAK